MKVQTSSHTRANFKSAIDYVIDCHDPILITSKSQDVILLSKENHDAIQQKIKTLSN